MGAAQHCKWFILARLLVLSAVDRPAHAGRDQHRLELSLAAVDYSTDEFQYAATTTPLKNESLSMSDDAYYCAGCVWASWGLMSIAFFCTMVFLVFVLIGQFASMRSSLQRELAHEEGEEEDMRSKTTDADGTRSDALGMTKTMTAREDSVDRAAQKLAEAKTQGLMRRWRVSAPPLFIGILMAVGGGMLAIENAYDNQPWTNWYVGVSSASFGFTLILMCILPRDENLILGVGVVLAAALCFLAEEEMRNVLDMHQKCAHRKREYRCYSVNVERCRLGLQASFDCWMAVYLLYFLCARPRRQCLHRMWLVLGFALLNRALSVFAWIWEQKQTGGELHFPHSLIFAMVHVFCGAFAISPRTRRAARYWLSAYGESRASAAGISELLSDRDADEVLAMAKATFLCVPAHLLREEDMADNKPNPELRAFAVPATLGRVDAFMSHSWHDDPKKKWAALQEWRKRFKKTHQGQEPTLWIDKYCIDQLNITDSLACLPVYLAGCKKFLALCDKTYLTRLWCVVEIFVFLEMSGNASDFEARVYGEGVEEMKHFDLSQARCFTDDDTRRLKDVLEAGGRGVDDLETFIRKKFR